MSDDARADPDILRAARYMIKQYGASALRRADGRALDLAREHQRGAALIWVRIAEAMRQIQD